MAYHKSALKRARQSEIRRLRNKSVRTRVKSVIKDVRSAAGKTSETAAAGKLTEAQSAIDIAAKKGVIHKKTAARKISRLYRRVNTVNS